MLCRLEIIVPQTTPHHVKALLQPSAISARHIMLLIITIRSTKLLICASYLAFSTTFSCFWFCPRCHLVCAMSPELFVDCPFVRKRAGSSTEKVLGVLLWSIPGAWSRKLSSLYVQDVWNRDLLCKPSPFLQQALTQLRLAVCNLSVRILLL